MGNTGLQVTPKAGSFLFTKGAYYIFNEAYGYLAQVSDDGVVEGLYGDWTGLCGDHLPCTQKVTLGLFPFVINKYIMRRCFEITFACA